MLVAVDATGYGSGRDQEHFTLQSGLVAVLNDAAAAADLGRGAWLKQGMGDGELAILPLDEPEPVVVDGYVRHLDSALMAHNKAAPANAKIRLRMAIHFGAAMEADNGFAGQGVVVVSRLVDSPPLRNALAAVPDANLAVILSRQVFDDVVRQGHVSFAATDFARVRVRMKEYEDDAWVKVIGVDSAAWRDGTSEALDGSHHDARPELIQHFHGDIRADGGPTTFGISYGARSGH